MDAVGVYCFSTSGESWPTPGSADLHPLEVLDRLTVESVLTHSAKGGGSRIADAINRLLDTALEASEGFETTRLSAS